MPMVTLECVGGDCYNKHPRYNERLSGMFTGDPTATLMTAAKSAADAVPTGPSGVLELFKRLACAEEKKKGGPLSLQRYISIGKTAVEALKLKGKLDWVDEAMALLEVTDLAKQIQKGGGVCLGAPGAVAVPAAGDSMSGTSIALLVGGGLVLAALAYSAFKR